MPCCRKRDNRGQPKAGCHFIVLDLPLLRGVVVLLNGAIYPQRSIALGSFQRLRRYLVPRIILEDLRSPATVFPPARRSVARPTVQQWHGIALLSRSRLVLPVTQSKFILRGLSGQRGIGRPHTPEGVRGQGSYHIQTLYAVIKNNYVYTMNNNLSSLK